MCLTICEIGAKRVKSLEEGSIKLFEWFSDNLMKSNDNKCHLLVSTNSTVNIRIANFDIKNSHCEKVLGVKFNHKLTFNSHSSDLCKKARVTPYMNISKRRIIKNAFFQS